MKTDLSDVTFLILIRLDSTERLENVLAVTHAITRYFDTNIHILEASDHNNGILQSLLRKKALYQYVEDKDPILYKTKLFNQMVPNIATPYLAIWDADIVPDRKAIVDTVEHLRKNQADAGYPYNGLCYNVPDIIRKLYLKTSNFKVLSRNIEKMKLLYGLRLYGGAVFVQKEKYIKAGMENEAYYGWGNDDFDRYARFCESHLTIYRCDTPLFHLFHPRGKNSQYNTNFQRNKSDSELQKRKNPLLYEHSYSKPDKK